MYIILIMDGFVAGRECREPTRSAVSRGHNRHPEKPSSNPTTRHTAFQMPPKEREREREREKTTGSKFLSGNNGVG